ncbi:MAG: DUF3179 domain-containing (seleno)protein [Acidobacteriota bacterium]
MPSRNRRAAAIAALAALALMTRLPSLTAQQDVPAGYKPVPGRASLGAIDDPSVVGASDARLRDDAWVVGVVIDGRARAYGLALLNEHEVVNDRIGDTELVVVWSPYANVAAAFDRRAGGRALEFEPGGGLLHGGLVLQDRESLSLWPVLRGAADAGPLTGTPLTLLPVADRMLWAEWVARHPDTDVLSVNRTDAAGGTMALQDPGENQHADFLASDTGYDGIEAGDGRLPDKALVYAFRHQGVAYAVDNRRVVGGQAFPLHDGSWALVYREASDRMFRGSAAFVSSGGFEQRGGSWFELSTDAEFNAISRDFGGAGIARLPGFDAFWYAWSLTWPATELLR